MHLLGSKSHHQLTLRMVAKASDVTPNALYRHYHDLEELLDYVAQHGRQELEGALKNSFSKESETCDRVLAIADAYIDFATTHQNLYALLMSPAGDLDEQARLTLVVRDLLVKGEIDCTTSEITQKESIVLTLLHGLATTPTRATGALGEKLGIDRNGVMNDFATLCCDLLDP